MKKSTEIAADVSTVVENSNRFALDLYAKLAADSKNNLFCSPSSLSLALAMTFAGAAGETAREMKDTLHFALSSDQLHKAFRQLQSETRTGGIDLRIANRLWGQQGYPFLAEFLETTRECYGAELAEVNFRTSTEQVRQQINQWIEEQTAGRIANLVGPGILDETTRLVLTNAIYFLGAWENEFDEDKTEEMPFWISSEKSLAVPMMKQTAKFAFGQFIKFQILELPYRSQKIEWKIVKEGKNEVMRAFKAPGGGSDFSMSILLPRKEYTLDDLEAEFAPDVFEKLPGLRPKRVNVILPKFRLESEFQLNETLQGLGMKKPFSHTEGDFSNMSDHPEGLYLEAVLHKAFVDVNEKGTEAAAASAAVMFGRSVEPDPIEFRVDRPFLFLIRDRRTSLIHFMGRVIRPSSQNQT